MKRHIGTCGWSFKDWKGSFYPAGTRDELGYYADYFDTVEIDSTWHRIPSETTVAHWHASTPPGFIFTPKLRGKITHELLLENSEELVQLFLNRIRGLRDKLGPILIQLAPRFAADRLPRLERFLKQLPPDLRFVVEFRHRSWSNEPEALRLLSELRIGLAMVHHPWYPRFQEATTDFTYLRLLGRRGVFSKFSERQHIHDDELRSWVDVLDSLPDDVERSYLFADNLFEGYATATAMRLQELLYKRQPHRLAA